MPTQQEWNELDDAALALASALEVIGAPGQTDHDLAKIICDHEIDPAVDSLITVTPALACVGGCTSRRVKYKQRRRCLQRRSQVPAASPPSRVLDRRRSTTDRRRRPSNG